MLGRELPTGTSPQERRIRRRSYALDALLFSAAIAVLSGIGLLIGDASAIDAIPLPLAGLAGAMLGAVLAGLIGFVVFYTLNYVIGESESRAVERRLARLERQSS